MYIKLENVTLGNRSFGQWYNIELRFILLFFSDSEPLYFINKKLHVHQRTTCMPIKNCFLVWEAEASYLLA